MDWVSVWDAKGGLGGASSGAGLERADVVAVPQDECGWYPGVMMPQGLKAWKEGRFLARFPRRKGGGNSVVYMLWCKTCISWEHWNIRSGVVLHRCWVGGGCDGLGSGCRSRFYGIARR